MLLYCFRLGLHTGPVDKEHDHLLVRDGAGIDAAMRSRLGRIPIGQARMDGEGLHFAGIPVLDAQRLAAHDDGEPVSEVCVPGQRFARLERVTPDDQIVSLRDGFRFHNVFP